MRLRLLLTALGTSVLAASAADPRSALQAGLEAYGAKHFEVAQKAFAAAGTNAAAAQLDPAVAKYNEAAADYRLGRMDTAAERLAEALRTGHLSLQQRAWYNRGNALLGRMAAQEQQGKLDEAKKSAEEAATHFEQAILLDPADADAKVNYELCLRLQQELEKKKQEQEKQQEKQDQQNKDKDKKDQQEKQDQQQQKKPDDDKQKQDQQPKPDQDQKQQDQQAAKDEKKDNEMTPDEALQLLNAMRQEEQAHRDKLRLNIGQPEPVEKDW